MLVFGMAMTITFFHRWGMSVTVHNLRNKIWNICPCCSMQYRSCSLMLSWKGQSVDSLDWSEVLLSLSNLGTVISLKSGGLMRRQAWIPLHVEGVSGVHYRHCLHICVFLSSCDLPLLSSHGYLLVIMCQFVMEYFLWNWVFSWVLSNLDTNLYFEAIIKCLHSFLQKYTWDWKN